MKVITEEEAIYFRNHLAKQDRNIGACAIDELISGNSEEIDTLTVSKLRPMSDAPKTGESFLVCFAGSNRLHEGYFDTLGNVWVGEQYYSSDLCSGWVPAVIYKPELTG